MPRTGHPKVVLIAGPNGAGKSTLAPVLLRDMLHVAHFVNADVIAQGLSAYGAEDQAVAAGRIMLGRLRELAAQRVDFAFESTLASRSLAPWLAEIVEDLGYRFQLVFLSLPSSELAIARVKARVRLGGHRIPDDVVRRRHDRGLRNLFELDAPLAELWRLYDNSGDRRVLLREGGRSKQRARKGVLIDRSVDRAIRTALRLHKRAGSPIPAWKNGKVVWIPASKIPVK